MNALFILIPIVLTATNTKKMINLLEKSVVACPLLPSLDAVLTSSLGMYLMNQTAIVPRTSGATQKRYTCLQLKARDPISRVRLIGPRVIPSVPPAPWIPSALGLSSGLNMKVVKLYDAGGRWWC